MAHEAAHAVEHALALSGSMTWEILWALILGFTLSAVVQAVVRRSTIVALLGDDRPRTLAVAAGLGERSCVEFHAEETGAVVKRDGPAS